MKKTMVTTAFLMAIAGAVHAQQLEPKDYSPTGDATIRTVGIKDIGGGNWRATVAIANRSPQPFNANFDCTLFDKAGEPFDNAGSGVRAVPPGQEVIAQSTSFSKKPDKVACRIEFTVPAD